MRQISSMPVKWLIFCSGFRRITRSIATEVSVQYKHQSSSSPTSRYPSLLVTSRSSGYLQFTRHTPSASSFFRRVLVLRRFARAGGPLSPDEKDSSTRNAGGDARAVVVAAWPTTSNEPRVARASFSSPLSPASEPSDSECVTSSEEEEDIAVASHDAWVPTGFGKSARRVVTASDRRVSACTRRAGTR